VASNGYRVRVPVALSDLFLGSIMRTPIKATSVTTSSEAECSIGRRKRARALDTADALRTEKRSASFATIDSNASKWRYPATVVTS